MEIKNNFKALSTKECAERILSVENPICFIHVNPDGDAVGSACALSEIFRQLGKECKIISADKIPSRLRFVLEKTDTCVADNFNGKSPIAIDVASVSQLGALYSEKNPPVLMIDHHRVGTPFSDGYINPDCSSAAEALLYIADELIKMGKVKMNEALAYALYVGISSDTGCFRYSNTTSNTHRSAARLLEFGVDSADVNHRLFTAKSAKQIKAEGLVASKIKTESSGKCAYASISIKEMQESGLSLEDFDTAIDVVRSLEGVEIAVFVKETSPDKFKASLRSTGPDVAKIAAGFGGGGHIKAAGCSPEAKNIEEAINMLACEINKLFI